MRNLAPTGDMVQSMSGERQIRPFLHYALIVLGSACAGLEPKPNGTGTDTAEATDSQHQVLDSAVPALDTPAPNDTADTLMHSDSAMPPTDVSDTQRMTNDSSSAVNDVMADAALFPESDVKGNDAQASPMSPCPDITVGNDFPVALHRLTANGQLGTLLSRCPI